MYTPRALRAICPGCGAALELGGPEVEVTCEFCGTQSRIVRQLRKVDPEWLDELKPEPPAEPAEDFVGWGVGQLLHQLAGEKNVERALAMARELDCWPRAQLKNVGWLPALCRTLKKVPEQVDRPLAGLIGKMLCSDDLELRRRVVEVGQRFAFYPHGTPGLLFALSLGDAATVRLLLEVAEDAEKAGALDYRDQALIGVQTAIGRERERRLVCVQILIYRLLELSSGVQEWVVRFLRNQFDVGYTDLLADVLELLDDCLVEAPHLEEGLILALRKCGRPKDSQDLDLRLRAHQWLRHPRAREAAWATVQPCYPEELQQVEAAVEHLLPFARQSQAALKALCRFVWCLNEVPEPFLKLSDIPDELRKEIERRGVL